MRNSRRPFSWMLGVLLVVVVLLVFYGRSGTSSTTMTSGQLQAAVAAWGSNHTAPSAISNSKQTQISSDGSTVTWYDNAGSLYTTTVGDSEQAYLDFKSVNYTNYTNAGSDLTTILLSLLPTLVLVGIMVFFVWWMLRQSQSGNNQAMSFGRSRARLVAGDKPSVTFMDVAGIDEAKQELGEIVEFLKYPDKFTAVGARIPKGVLLVGPPGTGKTLLSKAVAGEAGVPFLALTGSSFVELFVGVGASRVRDLFADARKRAPSIIFIDEVDAIGQRRGGSIVSNDERGQTLNQLLAEMDGFDPTTGVVVMAATNRPEVLDPALLRPGRFDREVEIPLPNQAERAAILAVHVEGKRLAPDVDFDNVARATPGSRERIWPISSTRRPSSPSVMTGTSSSPETSTRRGTGFFSAAGTPRMPSSPRRSTRWQSTKPAMRSSYSCPSTRTRWPRSPSRLPGVHSGHRTAARRRAAPLRRELPTRLLDHPPGRLSLGDPGDRRGIHRSGQRPCRGHRAGHQDGQGMGIVAPVGTNRVRIGPALVLERSPTWPGTTLCRGHTAGYRPRGQPPALRGRGQGAETAERIIETPSMPSSPSSSRRRRSQERISPTSSVKFAALEK